MITIPTRDLIGILADCIPSADPNDDFPLLHTVRLEWDGRQLHAQATDRYQIAWSTWDPDDEPDGDQQDDLFTEWGGADQPWRVHLPLPDAKDAVAAFKLSNKEGHTPLTASYEHGRLRINRSSLTGMSALTMVIEGNVDFEYPDIRKLLADHDTAEDAREIAFDAKRLATFAKVRPRGPLRMTFTRKGFTVVTIGERFVGAIQAVREADDQ